MSPRAASPPPRATTPEPTIQPLPSPHLRPARSFRQLKQINTASLSSHDEFHLTFDEFGAGHRELHLAVLLPYRLLPIPPQNLRKRPHHIIDQERSPVRLPRHRRIPTTTTITTKNRRADLGLLLLQLTTILHLLHLFHHFQHSSPLPHANPQMAAASIYHPFRYSLHNLRLPKSL